MDRNREYLRRVSDPAYTCANGSGTVDLGFGVAHPGVTCDGCGTFFPGTRHPVETDMVECPRWVKHVKDERRRQSLTVDNEPTPGEAHLYVAVHHGQATADFLRDRYPTVALIMVAQGWTIESTMRHLDGECDRAICTGAHED